MHGLQWTATKHLTVLLASAALAGCLDGGDGGSDSADSLSSAIGNTSVSGVVVDGPVISGEVVATDASGSVVATTRTGSDARYSLSFSNSDIEFPVTISVADGINLVTGNAPSFPLEVLLASGGGSATANLTPFSTLVASVAEQMPGGTSTANINNARQYVNDVFGLGLPANSDTRPTEGSDLAELVRASEAVAEAMRRASDALVTSGTNVNPQGVLNALAADLTDGSIDGAGAPGTDARVSAVVSVAAAQVLIESITTGLQVGGLDGNAAMDQALQEITGGDSSIPSTSDIPVEQGLLDQAANLVALAGQFNSDPTLDTLAERLGTVGADKTPAELEAMLPAASNAALEGALQDTAQASNFEIREALDAAGEPEPEPAPQPEPEPHPSPSRRTGHPLFLGRLPPRYRRAISTVSAHQRPTPTATA
jgi:hypothetical protein